MKFSCSWRDLVLKPFKSVHLKSAHCNNLKRKDCPFCCCTQQIRQSVVALDLIVKFSKVFRTSEILGLVLIYRRWNYQSHTHTHTKPPNAVFAQKSGLQFKNNVWVLLWAWQCFRINGKLLCLWKLWNGKGDFISSPILMLVCSSVSDLQMFWIQYCVLLGGTDDKRWIFPVPLNDFVCGWSMCSDDSFFWGWCDGGEEERC